MAATYVFDEASGSTSVKAFFATSSRPAVKHARNKVFKVRWFGFAMAVRGPHSWGACDVPARCMASISEKGGIDIIRTKSFHGRRAGLDAG